MSSPNKKRRNNRSYRASWENGTRGGGGSGKGRWKKDSEKKKK